jgi:hypothetical protein
MTALGWRRAVCATAFALALAAAPVPAAADQVPTSTAMQTNNGCVANGITNCTTFAS